MLRRSFVLSVAVLAIAGLVSVSACSDSGNDQGGRATSGVSTSGSAAGAHNANDVTFAHHMIQHHQQAIEMSDIVLGKQGIDPRVVNLANQIKAAQGPEIQQMQSWLSQWGASAMPTTTGMDPGQTAMPSMGPSPSQSGNPNGGGMPAGGGMMPEGDMAALRDAQGVEASKLFLSQMIEHHRGAISMAQNEIGSGQFPPATAMARSIVSSQQQEIDTMQNILASL
nr:DUF305 domain-containing protein [Mycobacterium kubicae]